jgi:lipoate-protein ligase A
MAPSVAPLLQGDTAAWLLWIDEQPRPGWANMAIDQALLDRAERLGESWLRLYQWAPFCLSFGRHEPAMRRYDRERIAALAVDTVRRPTGGRAVWHAQELTYAVAAPSARFGSLRAAYLEIHHMLANALSGLGVAPSLAPPVRTPALDAGACFSQPAGGEIMVEGRKVVGSAQFRQETAFLQHGSILLEDHQDVVRSMTRGACSPEPSLGVPVRNPSIAQRPLKAGEVTEAVTCTARARWSGTWQDVSGEESVVAGARNHYPRFRSAAWTWAR